MSSEVMATNARSTSSSPWIHIEDAPEVLGTTRQHPSSARGLYQRAFLDRAIK